MINKEQTCADEEQSDIIETDIKDSAKEQVEAVKIKGSRSEDTKVYACVKSSVKLRNKCSFEPFSITSMIFLSVLVSTVGAGKLKSVSGNEILKREFY